MKDNSILRWGIIGCGNVANRKGGPSLYSVPGSQLVAVMSRNPDKAKRFANQHGAKKYYDKIDELVNDGGINAVYVATPVSAHCPQTIAAAEVGKHVLCEKPMGMDVDECQRMIDACKKNNVTLMIAYYRRFFPNIMKVKELIGVGAIGKVGLVKVMTNSPFNPGKNGIENWRLNPQISGGGVLMDIGSHRLDFLHYLFGEADSIAGISNRVASSYPVEDSVAFSMQFRSGVKAMGYFGWSLPVKYDSVEIHGTKGKITVDSINSGRLQLRKDKEIKEFQLPVLEYTHMGLVRDFVQHIKTGSPILCSGEVGLKTNEMIAQIYENN